VTDDHDAIDELLAGYVLEGLSGPDAAEVDRLLAEHVPGCDRCHDTLDGFQRVMGELGLSASPMQPPDLLWPRLERDLSPRRTRRMPVWGAGRVAAAVAAVVVLVGVGGLVVTTAGGNDPVLANADLGQIQRLQQSPGASTTDVGEVDEVSAPGVRETYLMGTDVSMPPAGMTYRLWAIGSDGDVEYLGDFAPVNGVVALEVQLDAATVQLLVTLEPAASEPASPGQPAWPAA
jgi:anti-sigma-K factor RskA